MRFALTVALFWLAFSSPALASKIAPGMKFEAVKAALQNHGYEVDAERYGLAVVSRDRNIVLDFCRIDADIALIVAYDVRDNVVAELELYFTPERRNAQTHTVVRRALEIDLQEDGVYTLKLKRRTEELQEGD